MSRKRWIWLSVLLVIVGALGVGAWSMRDQFTYAGIAAGYAAKQTCSCLHVSGRTLDSCMADFPEDSRGMISVREDGDRVHASIMMGAFSSEAVYEEGYGCRVVN